MNEGKRAEPLRMLDARMLYATLISFETDITTLKSSQLKAEERTQSCIGKSNTTASRLFVGVLRGYTEKWNAN